jgi:stage IV sporulation protein FB
MGRLFGVTIRVHVLFPLVAASLILRVAFKKEPAYPPTYWIEACWLVGILFMTVLLHEFGHCFAARLVDGDAHEVLLWPLGGLASVDVPHTPRAQFIMVAGGPAVNLILCAVSASILLALSFSLVGALSPWWDAFAPQLYNWSDKATYVTPPYPPTENPQLGFWPVFFARVFWVNWVLALFNLLPGFPLDGGRLFQCLLWPRFGFRQSMVAAITAGIVVSFIVSIYAIVNSDMLMVFLGLFIFYTCRQQYIILETGGEESLFGYDFSQGYTSLERDAPPPPRRRRPNVWQRWQTKRAAQKLQRELEQRESEERRMDELLEKVQRQGLHALSEEERRFLTRVSAKYRNRQ